MYQATEKVHEHQSSPTKSPQPLSPNVQQLGFPWTPNTKQSILYMSLSSDDRGLKWSVSWEAISVSTGPWRLELCNIYCECVRVTILPTSNDSHCETGSHYMTQTLSLLLETDSDAFHNKENHCGSSTNATNTLVCLVFSPFPLYLPLSLSILFSSDSAVM